MSSRDFLRADTGVQDPWFWAVDNNVFAPRSWDTINGFHYKWHDVSPANSVTNLNTTANFTVPKTGDNVYKLLLRFDIQSLSGGNFQRFQDWIGYALIEELKITYSGNEIWKTDGDKMLIDLITSQDEQYIQHMAELANGNLTRTQRDTLADSNQVFYVELTPWFSQDTICSLPVNTLAHELNVDVTLRKATDVVQTDNSSDPTVTLNSVKLRMMEIFLHPEDRAQIQQWTLQDYGLVYKSIDFPSQTKSVSSGDASVDIKLSNIRHPVQDLIVVYRHDADLSTSKGNDRFNFRPIKSLQIQANNDDLLAEQLDDFIRHYTHPQFHRGPIGAFIYSMPHALDPDNKIHSTGSKNYGNMSDPTVTVKFVGDSADANGKLMVMTKTQNVIQLYNGDLLTLYK